MRAMYVIRASDVMANVAPRIRGPAFSSGFEGSGGPPGLDMICVRSCRQGRCQEISWRRRSANKVVERLLCVSTWEARASTDRGPKSSRRAATPSSFHGQICDDVEADPMRLAERKNLGIRGFSTESLVARRRNKLFVSRQGKRRCLLGKLLALAVCPCSRSAGGHRAPTLGIQMRESGNYSDEGCLPLSLEGARDRGENPAHRQQ